MSKLRKMLGCTVTDLRGRYRGIVVRETPNHEDEVLVRSWNPRMRVYILYSKHYMLLQIEDDLNELQRDDTWMAAHYASLAKELAVNTHDKEWFDTMNAQKQTE